MAWAGLAERAATRLMDSSIRARERAAPADAAERASSDLRGRCAVDPSPRAQRTIEITGGQGRPVILIIDDFGNEYFDQLAATLRRGGARMVRISGAGPLAARRGPHRLTRWVRDHCLYHTRVDAAELAEDGSLPARAGDGPILDVLCDENTLAAAAGGHPAILALAARGLAYRRRPPERLLDKFEINVVLHAAGVRIPPQVRVCAIGPQQALARFGLPLVVKAAIGAAGTGVRIAASLEEVERAVEELSATGWGEPFYQQYVDGQMVMYCAATGAGGPLIEHGFRVLATRWPLGPSAVVRLFDEPRLLAAGRLATRVLGCFGLAEIGFIRALDGTYWHVDANTRSWGNMISLLCAGVDYPQSYLALLSDRPWRPASLAPAAHAQDVVVLPAMLFRAASQGSRMELSAALAAFVTLCRRGPGLVYGSIALAKTAMLLARRAVRCALRSSARDLPRG